MSEQNQTVSKDWPGILNQLFQVYDLGPQGTIESTEDKTWVKIPTLHPKAPNALVLLSEANLEKLRARAGDALVKLRKMRAEREAERKSIKAGDRVRFTGSSLGSKPRYGNLGTVVSVSSFPGRVNAAWDGIGLLAVFSNEVEKVVS